MSAMIEFVTLLIGLTLGMQPVEITVSPEVSRVELWLDETRIGQKEEPPWRFQVEFGSELLPRELRALAFDSAGEELARVRQFVNLPRSAAEARLAFVMGEDGLPVAVQVSWESARGEAPEELVVAFDGQPLEVIDRRRIELPSYARNEIHFVTADIRFPDESRARAEATFGGVYGSEINTELTAVPVRVRNPKDKIDLAATAGWLEHRGKPLRVVAVEKGMADLVLVREQGAESLLRRLRAASIRRTRQLARRGATRPGSPEAMRYDLSLGARDRMIFVWPVVERQAHPRFSEVGFFHGQAFGFDQGGLFWFLTRLYPEELLIDDSQQRLADALAIAGSRAVSANRRRAVILITERNPQDRSRQTPASVQRYLEHLGAPLYVWSDRAVRPTDFAAQWGSPRPVQTLERLRGAFREVERDIGSQRILWVEGRYLPHRVELGKAAPRWVELLH